MHYDVEAEGNYNRTPLNFASYRGHLPVVKYLIEEAGANHEHVDFGNETPLKVAEVESQTDVVEYLHQISN